MSTKLYRDTICCLWSFSDTGVCASTISTLHI
jgi:hypothetical protein